MYWCVCGLISKICPPFLKKPYFMRGQCLQFIQLEIGKVCLLVTDGAPAMIGRVQGLIARLSAIAPRMQFLHCIIHQSLLCAQLSGDL